MDADRLIAMLERNGRVLATAVDGITPEDAKWRPDDGAWSILEIIRHLFDEEQEDFRTRVEHTLRDPEAEWPSIDPAGWATERRYNDGDLDDAVKAFLERRGASVRWLRSLDGPNWGRTHTHPKLPPLRAGDVLVSWVAHDALHLRQIAKRLYQLIDRDGGDYSVAYAGRWSDL